MNNLSLQKNENRTLVPASVCSDIYTNETEDMTDTLGVPLHVASGQGRSYTLLNRDGGTLHWGQSAARGRPPHALQLPPQSPDLRLLHLDDP